MIIKIKNNRKREIENEVVKKIAKFYLANLIGEDKFKEIRTLEITFKKLAFWHGGYLRTTRIRDLHYIIAINSINSLEEQLSTLAHECVHIKQYVLKELAQRHEFSGGRVKHIRIWKGREYQRIAYDKKPWEIEARKLQDNLSDNILNKINEPTEVITKPLEVAPVLNTTRELVLSILNGGITIPNGELVPRVLNGNKDKQKTLKVLREVFALKESGVIQEYNQGSLIYVRSV